MYNAFYNLIYNQLFANGSYIDDYISSDLGTGNSPIFFSQYLSILLALICTITVYVCVCLMVVKIIKLFARLWSRF